jgi:hypothetical protein
MEYFKRNELNEVLATLLGDNRFNTRCEVEFSESLDTDCVNIYQNDELIKTEKIEDILGILSVHINAKITSYDVIEIGDDAEHFVFFVDAFNSLNKVA